MTRRIRITVSTVWTVPEEDTVLADRLLKEQKRDTACGYIEDAWHGSKDMDTPTVRWEEIQPSGNWTPCSCGHIAQMHNRKGKCSECGCTNYYGECT